MDVADRIADELEKHERKYKTASLVVCGGYSVLSIFRSLSSKDLNWENILITLVDDRLVSSNDKDSNVLLIKENLLINFASKAKFIPLNEEIIDSGVISLPFTVMLLSMGSDGHFASIFSGILNDKNFGDPNSAPKILKTRPQGDLKHCRITMNLAMILESKSIFLLIHGKDKLKIFEAAKTNRELPVNRLIEQNKSTLIIDQINK